MRTQWMQGTKAREGCVIQHNLSGQSRRRALLVQQLNGVQLQKSDEGRLESFYYKLQ